MPRVKVGIPVSIPALSDPACPRCLGHEPGMPGGDPDDPHPGPFADDLCKPCYAAIAEINRPKEVLAVQKIEPGRGKREPWHPRWAVVERLSGKGLAIGYFVRKETANRAMKGAEKSAARLVAAVLADKEPFATRAKIVLKRYFLAWKATEGFESKDRWVYRYPRTKKP